jgi:hypothetical protein
VVLLRGVAAIGTDRGASGHGKGDGGRPPRQSSRLPRAGGVLRCRL